MNILIVTDLHSSFDNINKLNEKLKNESFDLVLCPGDIVNYDPGKERKIQWEQCGNEMKEVLEGLKQFSDKVLFIPGNHDHTWEQEEFVNELEKIEGVFCIHDKLIELKDNIFIAGFGGSVDSLQNGKVFWEGYPFQKDLLDFESLKKKIEENKKQLILMTHCGPSDVRTTMDCRFEKSEGVIFTGSDMIRDIIYNNTSIKLAIHGHTHHAPGISLLQNQKEIEMDLKIDSRKEYVFDDQSGEKVPVVNPGALKNGRYGILKLSKNEENNIWKMEKISIYDL